MRAALLIGLVGLALTAAPATAPAWAPAVRIALACTADTSICLHAAEVDLNQGGKHHLRLKGIQHLLLLDFDFAPLAGRAVLGARLVLTPSGPVKLKTLGISTVAAAWGEGKGTDAPAGPGECSSRQAGRGTWMGEGSDILDATFTAGGTLVDYADVESLPDGRIAVAVAPRLVHACVRGESFGLIVCDEKGQTAANNDFRSREDGAGAVLEVEAGDGQAPGSGARAARAPATPAVRQFPPFATIGPASFVGSPRSRLTAWLAPASGTLDAPGLSGSRRWAPSSFLAPRGGTVGCVCVVKAPAVVPQVTAPGLGPCEVWRVHALDSDGADPLGPPRTEPDADGYMRFYVACHVPADADVRKYVLTIRAGEVPLALGIFVARAALAAAPDFHISLNGYGSPGGALGDPAGSPEFVARERDAYRLARADRCTLTPLPYSQSGQVDPGLAPVRRSDGTWDWTAYDARLGPLLDGSAFADLPGGAIPIDHLYLPLHENWPSAIAPAYAYRGTLDDHWRDAPPIERAFSAAYAEAWREAATAFVKHARAKGWTRTRFLAYLNNKVDYRRTGRGTSWWLLDEPAYRDDFLALAWFARLFREGLAAAGPDNGRFLFRLDLSRPEWRRDHLDGLLGLVVTNRWADRRSAIKAKANRFGEEGWSYGEAPAPDRPAVETWAWAVRAYLAGADGLVPWQSIGRQDSWEKPEGTALILPARPGMPMGFYPTLRLKALRAAVEAADLVRQVVHKLGWTRFELAAALDAAGILPASGSPPPDAPERAISALCALLDGWPAADVPRPR